MDGIEISNEVLLQTQSNIIAQNAVHIAQLEAAVQQLAQEKDDLQSQIFDMAVGNEEAEAVDGSA